MLKFELSEQMIAVIGEALSAQPFKIAAPVIAELQKQINDQKQAESAAKEAKQNGDGQWASAPSAS